ncbi:MAG TPA: hypothetical protein VF171_05035 [Trueperaceae bacterium]
MRVAPSSAFGPPSPGGGRNFWLGVYNGILINGAEAFFHSSLVLAPFLAQLGAPAVVIGLIPALRVGGWSLPQLFVAGRLAHEPFKLPWYRRMSLVRVGAFLFMALSVFLFGHRPDLVVLVTLGMIGVNAVVGGITGVSFAEVTAKVVPHYRLGTFWALRNAIGGLLALLSGLLLRRMLASDVPFPTNFGYLFLLGSLLTGAAYLCFSLVREPAGKPSQKEPLAKMLGRALPLLKRDPSFRRYLRVRFLALLSLLAEPFYAIYALETLDAPPSILGLFVILATLAAIAANFAFRVPANRGANVTVFQVSVALLASAPFLALVLPSWQSFALVFMCSAAGQSGMGIASWNLLYALSPEEGRPLYVGTANTLLSLPSLAPIVAGGLVGAFGFHSTFLLACLVAVSALAFTFRFASLRILDLQALAHD